MCEQILYLYEKLKYDKSICDIFVVDGIIGGICSQVINVCNMQLAYIGNHQYKITDIATKATIYNNISAKEIMLLMKHLLSKIKP